VRARSPLARAALALAFTACAAPTDPPRTPTPAAPAAPSAPSPAPSSLWPQAERAPALRASTLLAIRETRRIEGIETESSELRVRWDEVDSRGRGRRAEVVVLREERGRGAELRSTPNAGRRFTIQERNGALRLLEGEDPHFRDETDRQPALFARVLASGGHAALRPEEPRAIGARWEVPLGRYLAEMGLAGAPSFEGTVRARRAEDRDGLVVIAFEVALRTPERFRRDAGLDLRGAVLFDRVRGIALEKHSAGTLREEGSERAIEVTTEIEVLAEGPEREG
jgi:hypothetical protein